MTTGKAMWALARYRPWFYLLNFGLWTLVYVIPLGMGLLTGAFFDALSGKERAGLSVWTIIVLLAGVQVSRMGVLYAAIVKWSDFWFTMEALLRQNMLKWLVEGPGARVRRGSSGEMGSAFRDGAGGTLADLGRRRRGV